MSAAHILWQVSETFSLFFNGDLPERSKPGFLSRSTSDAKQSKAKQLFASLLRYAWHRQDFCFPWWTWHTHVCVCVCVDSCDFYCSEAPLWFPWGHRWTVELNFGKNIYASSVYWSCPLLALKKRGKNLTFQELSKPKALCLPGKSKVVWFVTNYISMPPKLCHRLLVLMLCNTKGDI